MGDHTRLPETFCLQQSPSTESYPCSVGPLSPGEWQPQAAGRGEPHDDPFPSESRVGYQTLLPMRAPPPQPCAGT